MGEKIVIETAKDAKKLDETYTKVKGLAKGYGFKSVAELKGDVVKKAMADAKKQADFIVEADIAGKSLIVQLVCDVKGKMRSVIGRSEIKDKKEFQQATALAKVQSLKKVFPD